MIGEKNLKILLAEMSPVLHEDEFVFCTVDPNDSSCTDLKPICRFREAEGEALIITRKDAEKSQIPFIYPCRMITLNVYSSLDAVGFLAAITTKLAEAGISVNPVSAFYHDHLFVPTDKADRVMQLLAEFSA